MFKGTSVARRNLLGKDGGLGCEVEGVYKKKIVLIEGDQAQISKVRVTRRTLREESEQWIFLCIIGFLEQSCT